VMSTSQITLDQVAELASQMPPDDQVQLMERILSALRRSLRAESVPPIQYERTQRFAMMREQTVDLDITDLAREHDHYLYGTPKQGDSTA
jgi:hypothetical protein